MTSLGWRVASLGDLVSLVAGSTPKGLIEHLIDGPAPIGNIPFFKVGDMNLDPVYLGDARVSLSRDAAQRLNMRVVPEGAVVFPKAGGAIATNKKRVVAAPGAIDLNCMAAVPGRDIDGRFLRLWFESIDLSRLSDGSVLPQLSKKTMANVPVLLPPLEEQRRIVEILEDHLSRLDAASTYLESAGARQARLVDRYLSAAVAALSPRAWPVAELLSQPLINGRSVPTADAGFPVLRLTALQEGRIDLTARKTGAWTASEAAPFLVRERDFLIARGNGSLRLVGRGGLVVTEPDPVAFPDTLIRIRTQPDMVHPEFLALVWNGSEVRRQIEAAAKTTAGIYKINQKDVERVVLPLPTLTQQTNLAADVSAFQDFVERLDRARTASVARGQALRRALLAAAFSGRLIGRSTDAEVVEELASV
jgi:type I restriction enzyme S subunit